MAEWYKSPINLPEAKSGNIEIRHKIYPAGAELPVIGLRQAILRGVKPVKVVLSEPLRVHELHEDGVGVWMTDLPEELNQIGELLQEIAPVGNVLVGGLGLGILARTIKNATPFVTSVTVVEINKDIINLCGQGLNVIHDDIFNAVATLPRFSCYLLDTWQGTNESEWWQTVMPLKRIIRNRFGVGPQIWCWAEDIMAGQVINALQNRVGHWYYKDLEPMTEKQAKFFVRQVGTKAWEQKYGHLFPKKEV